MPLAHEGMTARARLCTIDADLECLVVDSTQLERKPEMQRRRGRAQKPLALIKEIAAVATGKKDPRIQLPSACSQAKGKDRREVYDDDARIKNTRGANTSVRMFPSVYSD